VCFSVFFPHLTLQICTISPFSFSTNQLLNPYSRLYPNACVIGSVFFSLQFLQFSLQFLLFFT
jgi:hypothetical protein